MRIILFQMITLISMNGFADDQWFCTDDQAMRSGNTMMICGIGTSGVEGEARKRALNYAINEFETICNLSSDCKGRKVIVEPKRSSCSAHKPINPYSTTDIITCHRMFTFTLQ